MTKWFIYQFWFIDKDLNDNMVKQTKPAKNLADEMH